mgnify:CR=1 FL=1
MLDSARLDQLLEQFSGRTIALLGDLFLDRYLEIDNEIQEDSIETGLEVHHVVRTRNSPGALGTVINNLAALGAQRLIPVTVIGDDGHGYDLIQSLQKLPVDLDHVIQSPGRMTPTYVKPIRQDATGEWQELNRLDLFSRSPLDDDTIHSLAEHLQQVVNEADGLIVLDQMNDPQLGVVNSAIRQLLHELASRQPISMIIDSRRHLHAFDCGILKGNVDEIQAAWATLGGSQEEPTDAVLQLARHTGQLVYCTCGDQGAVIGHPDGECDKVDGEPVEGAVDIVGAGDSATSGFFLSLLSSATPAEAAEVGNLVASITVTQLGTTGTATPEQLRQKFEAHH